MSLATPRSRPLARRHTSEESDDDVPHVPPPVWDVLSAPSQSAHHGGRRLPARSGSHVSRLRVRARVPSRGDKLLPPLAAASPRTASADPDPVDPYELSQRRSQVAKDHFPADLQLGDMYNDDAVNGRPASDDSPGGGRDKGLLAMEWASLSNVLGTPRAGDVQGPPDKGTPNVSPIQAPPVLRPLEGGGALTPEEAVAAMIAAAQAAPPAKRRHRGRTEIPVTAWSQTPEQLAVEVPGKPAAPPSPAEFVLETPGQAYVAVPSKLLSPWMLPAGGGPAVTARLDAVSRTPSPLNTQPFEPDAQLPPPRRMQRHSAPSSTAAKPVAMVPTPPGESPADSRFFAQLVLDPARPKQPDKPRRRRGTSLRESVVTRRMSPASRYAPPTPKPPSPMSPLTPLTSSSTTSSTKPSPSSKPRAVAPKRSPASRSPVASKASLGGGRSPVASKSSLAGRSPVASKASLPPPPRTNGTTPRASAPSTLSRASGTSRNGGSKASAATDVHSHKYKRVNGLLSPGRVPGSMEFMLHTPAIQAQFLSLWNDDACAVAVGDQGFAVVYDNGCVACSTAAHLDRADDGVGARAAAATPGLPPELVLHLESLHAKTLEVAPHEPPATMLPPAAQITMLTLGSEDRFFVVTREGGSKWHASPAFGRVMASLVVARDVASVCFGDTWDSWIILLTNGTARFSRIPDGLRSRLTGIDGPMPSSVHHVTLTPGAGYFLAFTNGAWESRDLPQLCTTAVDAAVSHYKGRVHRLVAGGWGTFVLLYGPHSTFGYAAL